MKIILTILCFFGLVVSAQAAESTLRREIIINAPYATTSAWWQENYPKILAKNGIALTDKKDDKNTYACHALDTDWKFTVQEKLVVTPTELTHTTRFVSSEAGGLLGHTGDFHITPVDNKTSKITINVYLNVQDRYLRGLSLNYQLRVLMSVAYVRTKNMILMAFPE